MSKGRIYCEAIISLYLNVTYIITPFDALYRYILNKSLRYALDVFTKHEIKSLGHWEYINMSNMRNH